MLARTAHLPMDPFLRNPDDIRSLLFWYCPNPTQFVKGGKDALIKAIVWYHKRSTDVQMLLILNETLEERLSTFAISLATGVFVHGGFEAALEYINVVMWENNRKWNTRSAEKVLEFERTILNSEIKQAARFISKHWT